MNGSKSTFMRTGYWLTALAALVLLAASPGTAQAQTVRIDSVTVSPSTVGEGEEATATVRFTLTAGDTAVTDDNEEVTVGFTWSVTGLGDSPAAADADDASFLGLDGSDAEEVTVDIPASIAANASRTFTATYSFRTRNDLDAENGQYKVGAVLGDWGSATDITTPVLSSKATIEDDELQTYTLSIPQDAKGAIKEGGAGEVVTLLADPGRSAAETVPDFTVVYELGGRVSDFASNGSGITVAELTTTSPGAEARASIGTIARSSADKNRVDDTLTLKLYSGGVGDSDLVTELAITVEDIHKLAAPDHITAVAENEDGDKVTEIVEGGDPIYLTVTVDRGASATRDTTTTEELTVDLRASAGQAGDFDVEPSRVTLAEKASRGKSSSDVEIKLTALKDQDVGPEDLVLQLVVAGSNSDLGPGTSIGTFTIPIMDETAKKVAPQSEADAYPKIMAAMEAGAGEDGLNPGESFMVMTADLFTVTEGYEASYKASVDGEAVSISASSEKLTVEAKSAGTAKVTVTATATMPGSSFIPEQTVSDVAHITFPVTVVDTPLSVMVTADPMEIEEGGTSMIIATASRAIEAGDGAVEIDLIVVGDATLAADSIMIAAGDMSGYTMLTATADDDMDDEMVVVVASGSGITTSMQVEVAVTDTTEPVVPEPVPALPLLGQLLLGLGLLGGGARHLYRRRQG